MRAFLEPMRFYMRVRTLPGEMLTYIRIMHCCVLCCVTHPTMEHWCVHPCLTCSLRDGAVITQLAPSPIAFRFPFPTPPPPPPVTQTRAFYPSGSTWPSLAAVIYCRDARGSHPSVSVAPSCGAQPGIDSSRGSRPTRRWKNTIQGCKTHSPLHNRVVTLLSCRDTQRTTYP